MADWLKEKYKLKKNHNWKAPDGYRIFVADRGAVRFNIPDGWIVEPDADCVVNRVGDRGRRRHRCDLADADAATEHVIETCLVEMHVDHRRV